MVEDFQAQTEALADETGSTVLAIYAAYLAGQILLPEAEAAIATVVNQANAAATALADAFIAAQIEAGTGTPAPSIGIAPVDDYERLTEAAHTILTAPPKTAFTNAEVRNLIKDAGLTPKDFDVPAITRQVNAVVDQRAAEAAEGEQNPIAGVDFYETVAENAKDAEASGLLWDDLDAGRYDDQPPVWQAEPEAADMRLERMARAEPLATAQRAASEAMTAQPLVEGWVRAMDADPCQLCVWWSREGRVWPRNHPFQTHQGCNCSPRIVFAQNVQSTVFTRRLERAQAPTGTRFPRE